MIKSTSTAAAVGATITPRSCPTGRARVLRMLAAVFAGGLLVAACDTGRGEPVVIGEYHAPVGTGGSR